MSRDTYRDSRAPPRERRESPPPIGSARSYRPGPGTYSSNFNPRDRDSGAPYRDAPRGPRGVNETPRGPSSTPFRGSRGGFGARSFEPRESRDPNLNNDRLYEGGDRWNPPRVRSPVRRDSQHIPRQLDIDRSRQETRDGPPSAGSNPADAGYRVSGPSFRGGYRPGRGDTYRNDRARPDDRAPRPRSRDRSVDSSRLDFRERQRNTDERSYVRDRIDERDSYTRRADPPSRVDTRPSLESRSQSSLATPQNERPPGLHVTPPDRLNGELRRDFDSSRRGSTLSDGIRDVRRDADRLDPNAGRPGMERAPRPASPPPAVPSFGFRASGPFSGVTSLSWKNPNLEVAKPPPASGPAQPTKTAPTAPKALTAAPPSAPRADRVLENTPSKESLVTTTEDVKDRGISAGTSPSPRLTQRTIPDSMQQPKYSPSSTSGSLNPPVGPRAMTSPQPPSGPRSIASSFGRALSPIQTHAQIPAGPKAGAVNASPRPMSSIIPTGPRAERGPPPSGPRIIQPVQKLFKSNSQTFGSRPSIVPSKRNVDGIERGRSLSNEAKSNENAIDGQSNTMAAIQSRPAISVIKQEAPISTAAGNDVSMVDVPPTEDGASPTAEDGRLQNLTDDEDDDLDLADLAEMLEDRFMQDKQRWEAKRIDLSAAELRPTLLFPELARLVAMRAMVNDLSYRSRAPTEKKEAAGKIKEPQLEATPAPSVLAPPSEAAPTDNQEDQDQAHGDDAPMSDVFTSRESSLDRLSTPDPSELPYLEKGPPTPLSDPDPFSVVKEIPEADIKSLLQNEVDSEAAEQARLEQEFRILYTAWKRNAMQLDWQREEMEREAKQCSPESIAPPTEASGLPVPALPNSTEGGRRAHRWASEYELQRVMEISLREEEEKKQKEMALKEAQVNVLADREAAIPPLLSAHEAKLRCFEDVSQARQPRDAIRIFEFVPPIDDFTEEEDRKMREVYKEYPKVWGTIAKALKTRTYKECINHYYASKWDKPYKSRVGGKRGRARGIKKGPRQRSALMPAQDEDTDAAGVPMVTESGRPKRAAAPVWPKDSDQEPGGAVGPNTKKNGKIEAETVAEKPKRKTKEKVPKKTARNQPIAARPTVASPQKVDRESKEKMGAQSMDIDDSYHMRIAQATEPMPPLMQQPHAYQESGISMYRDDAGGLIPLPDTRPRSHSNTQRQGASSYWSVIEEQDFQRCLEYYGTDFQAIANHMGTKTHTMIKNHYQKFVNDGKHEDLIHRANEATTRRTRGEDMGPAPSASQPLKRHGRYDTTNMTLPRSLVPNSEMPEIEQSPPASVAVPFGSISQQPFGTRATVPADAPRSSAALPTSIAGSRPHQTGPMLGYFREDRPPQNVIRPLIAPPEERREPPRERIKTEFRPAEAAAQRTDLVQQQREHDRELQRQEQLRRAELESRALHQEIQNAQMIHADARERERERMLQRQRGESFTSRRSGHGLSPTTEPVRHESRGSHNIFGTGLTGPNAHVGRHVHNEHNGQPHHQSSSFLDRRPQSPAIHPSQAPYAHQPQQQPQSTVPSPAPTVSVAKEPPRRSNLMSLLNSEPEPEAPKRRDPEPLASLAQHNRITTSVHSETPPSVASAREPLLDRPYSRPTYPPTGHTTSSLSTPTHESGPGRESLPPMAQHHRDSWPGNRPGQPFGTTQSPHLHAQHGPPISDRAPLFGGRDYRQTAFAGLNQPTRANASPPPASASFPHHSRGPSYNHTGHHTPPSSTPLPPANQPPSMLHYGQREQIAPGISPHLGPQHHPPPTSRPEFVHRMEPREAMFDRFRERDRDPRDRGEQPYDFAAVRERERERDREREMQQEAMYQHQQRFGHHTPPVAQPRFAPPGPPQPLIPERTTATPLSYGGHPASSARQVEEQQVAARQRQFDYEEEQRRRHLERERTRHERGLEVALQAEEVQRQILRRQQEQAEAARRGEARYGGMPAR